MESTHVRTLTFEDLYQEVRKLAHTLRELGVVPGDRVCAFSPSNAEVVVGMLASASLGAVWSSTPSEFGVTAVLERFTQIEPKVIFTADSYRYNAKTLPVYDKLNEILDSLPTVKDVIVVGQLSRDRKPRAAFPSDLKGRRWHSYVDLAARGEEAPKDINFHRGSAMAPLYVLYSSGSTGKPKAIVHSVGGMVLSQWMCNTLANSYREGDSFMQVRLRIRTRHAEKLTLGAQVHDLGVDDVELCCQASHQRGHGLSEDSADPQLCLHSTMGRGVAVVAYDGSPLNPQDIFFRLIDKYQVTVLGTSPRYLQTLETAGYKPNRHHSLKSLHTVATAGSVLKAELYDYVYENFGHQIVSDAPAYVAMLAEA